MTHLHERQPFLDLFVVLRPHGLGGDNALSVIGMRQNLLLHLLGETTIKSWIGVEEAVC